MSQLTEQLFALAGPGLRSTQLYFSGPILPVTQLLQLTGQLHCWCTAVVSSRQSILGATFHRKFQAFKLKVYTHQIKTIFTNKPNKHQILFQPIDLDLFPNCKQGALTKMDCANGMENLPFPDEIVVKILGYLSLGQLIQCARVSKRLNTICKDKSLSYKANMLKINNLKVKDRNSIIDILITRPNVTEVSISSWKRARISGVSETQKSTGLIHLFNPRGSMLSESQILYPLHTLFHVRNKKFAPPLPHTFSCNGQIFFQNSPCLFQSPQIGKRFMEKKCSMSLH